MNAGWVGRCGRVGSATRRDGGGCIGGMSLPASTAVSCRAMNLYDLTVPQLIKMLKNVDRWLATTTEHAEKKKFDVNNLMKFRFAPDQFAFDRQIQTVCDNAKFVAGRLTGK